MSFSLHFATPIRLPFRGSVSPPNSSTTPGKRIACACPCAYVALPSVASVMNGTPTSFVFHSCECVACRPTNWPTCWLWPNLCEILVWSCLMLVSFAVFSIHAICFNSLLYLYFRTHFLLLLVTRFSPAARLITTWESTEMDGKLLTCVRSSYLGFCLLVCSD